MKPATTSDTLKPRILICGILPPPYFGHSMMYKMLMSSRFLQEFDVTFLNLHFWTYGQHKRVTLGKLWKLVVYLGQYLWILIRRRPQYVLYNMSFDKMPFLKDVLFCFLGHLFGAKIILHDMGQYARDLYESLGKTQAKLFRWLMKHTTASIVLGEATRQVYEGLMDTRRVLAVPGSVEDSYTLPTPKSGTLSVHAVPTVKVLYFSFLSVSKGVWTALKAIPQVVAQYPQVRFSFAGPMESETLRDEIQRYLDDQKLNDYVDYLGYVGDDARRTEIFRQHDIFIFPTHRDVFGLVLLHAMAEGLPVIASKEGAIPEIVKDLENGFLFPKGDWESLATKIVTLARDSVLRRRMGQTSRQLYLAHFTPEVYAQRMITACQLIISGEQRHGNR